MRRFLVLWSVFTMAPALTLLSAQTPSPVPTAESILGVRIGATLDEARAQLERLGTPAGRDTRDGGRKEAWTLDGTEYGSVAIKTDGRGRVVWVTGFVRLGREIPFSGFGDLSRAISPSGSRAVWDVRDRRNDYRLILRGTDGKAQVVTLLAL